MSTKDPAVLFYTADFLADTVLWTYEELGRYIKLLCIQHLQGGISEDDFIAVAGTCKRVSDKFVKGEDGLYRNKRMAEETENRRKFTESRRNNASKRTTSKASAELVQSICNASAEHMGNENINENIDINDIENIIKYLNDKVGSTFDAHAPHVVSCVASCMRRGHTHEEMIEVIDYKAREWLNSNMAKYLRPSTLFGDKFERYLEELGCSKRTPPKWSNFNPDEVLRRRLAEVYGEEAQGNGT